MMQTTDIRYFIKSLEITVPDDKEFLKLSKSTPMYPENEELHSINYERGILLYALIAKYKPQNVLEIGTAKGYQHYAWLGQYMITIFLELFTR